MKQVRFVKTTFRYQLTNHLGSASLELDETAEIITYEEYHPFGTSSYRSGSSETEVSLKRYKYVFKELDNERRSPLEHLDFKLIKGEKTGLYYYGMRYYAAPLARFVSVDPLQFKYPELTPFQYASNRPISGTDLDGAEFALRLYSPLASKEMNKAIKDGDIIKQRGVSFWALNKNFPDDWAQGLTTGLIHRQKNSAALLEYRPEHFEPGVTVYLYGYFNKNGNYVDSSADAAKIDVTDIIHFSPSKAKNYDKYYPVDIGLFVGNYEKADGSRVYDDNDFEGYFYQTSIFGNGDGIVEGRMKGFGYIQYSIDLIGITAEFNIIEAGPIIGKYMGELPTIENPDKEFCSFIGYGTTNTLTGYWKSQDGLWEGFSSSFANLGFDFKLPGGFQMILTEVLNQYTKSANQKEIIDSWEDLR